MTSIETQDSSAVNLMRIAGFLFFAVAATNATLQVLGQILELLILTIIATVLLGLAIILLGLSAKRIALISPGISRSADIAGGWLIGFIVLNILSAVFLVFFGTIFGILALVVRIIAIIARIVGFHQLNNVFKSLSGPDYRMNSVIFPLYGWYGVLSVVALIISEYINNSTVVLIVSIIVIVGEILLLIAIGYKLIRNSFKIQTTIKSVPTTAQILSADQIRAQVKEYAAEAEIPKKKPKQCIKCGDIIEHRGNYCEKCVTNR
ncbi:MAG: hypothetical protein ACTSPF_06200 [Candidatus Heimdallarchaeaceae archaeon]